MPVVAILSLRKMRMRMRIIFDHVVEAAIFFLVRWGDILQFRELLFDCHASE